MQGVCESADAHAAAAELRARRLFVIDLRPGVASGGVLRGRVTTSVLGFLDRQVGAASTKERLQFLRQMSLMLHSGVPLLKALDVFAAQCPRPSLGRSVQRVSQRISRGESFAAALAQERRLLPPLAIKMISIGETIGKLDDILDRLADQFERQAELRSTLLASLTYPVLLVLVTIAVVVFLVTHVVPKFAHVLANRDLAMPRPMQYLISTSEAFQAHGLHAICGLLGLAAVLFLLSRISVTRYWLDRLVLSVPLIGGLLTLAFLAYFGRTLAMLLRSGVPILDALGAIRDSVGNQAMAQHLERAATQLLAGRPLSESIRSRLIPPMVAEVIAIGELSGTLDR
jgi:type IV pilus assembly protein PilC